MSWYHITVKNRSHLFNLPFIYKKAFAINKKTFRTHTLVPHINIIQVKNLSEFLFEKNYCEFLRLKDEYIKFLNTW